MKTSNLRNLGILFLGLLADAVLCICLASSLRADGCNGEVLAALGLWLFVLSTLVGVAWAVIAVSESPK